MDALFPPGPQKSLLLGDAPHFTQAPLDYMLRAARAYGAIVHFRFGPSHAYLLTDPREAHSVLVERFDQFAEHHSLGRALNSAMGHDLFAPEDHVRKKRLIRGSFDSAWVARFTDDIVTLSAPALRDWQGGDPLPMLSEIASRLVTRTLFDDAEGHYHKITQQLARVIFAQRDDRSFQSPLTPPIWIPTAQNRRRQKAKSELKRIGIMLSAEHRTWARDSIFSRLLQRAASDAAAFDELLSLLFAGTEALTHTLAWALYLLAKNPAAAESLSHEIDNVAGTRSPTSADLPNLTYTEMVLKETMRLYPPVWLISRQAKRETRIGDYYVPSGSTIFVSPYVIHHSPRYFTSPEKFLPERYGESLQRSSGFANLPFGAGRFASAEQDFMLSLAKPLLALAMQQFTPALSAPDNVKIEAELSLRPVGLNLQPVPRRVSV